MPKGRKKKPNILLIGSVIILLGVFIWNYYSYWRVSQLTIATAKQGWVKHEKKVKTVFANTEIILTTPAEGKFIPLQEDGRRFRKGETVGRLVPTGVDPGQSQGEIAITAPISGLFYSGRDGLEPVITPENLMNMDLKALLAQTENAPSPVTVTDSVSKHSPVGKMVNNLYPSWMFVYLEASDQMAKGETVKFIIAGEEYAGTVMKLSGEPKGAVVRFTQYINGTTEGRVKDIIWSYKPSSKGTLVPVASLCSFGEEKGVYVGVEGVIRYTPVRVMDYNDTMAVVEGIPEGAQVIANPKKGIEGLTIGQ